MDKDSEHYQHHRDDRDEWGDAVVEKSKRKLGAMVSVRLTPDELKRIQDAAGDEGLSVSAFLRRAALSHAPVQGSMTLTYHFTMESGVAATSPALLWPEPLMPSGSAGRS